MTALCDDNGDQKITEKDDKLSPGARIGKVDSDKDNVELVLESIQPPSGGPDGSSSGGPGAGGHRCRRTGAGGPGAVEPGAGGPGAEGSSDGPGSGGPDAGAPEGILSPEKEAFL